MNQYELEQEVLKRKAEFRTNLAINNAQTIVGLSEQDLQTGINMNVMYSNLFNSSVNSTVLANQYKNLTYSCVNLRADNFGKSKFILNVSNNQTEDYELDEHIFIDVINTECYNWMNENISYDEMKWYICQFMDLYGNAFVEVNRNKLDKPSKLRLLISEKEYWNINTDSFGIVSYTYLPNSKEAKRTIAKGNILHFAGPRKRATDLFGMSIIEAGIDIFYLDNSVNIYQQKYFDNDAIKKFVLTSTKDFKDVYLQNYLNRYNSENAGQYRAGKVPIFPNGIEPKLLSDSPHEADHIETWKFISTRIMALFRTTPSLIGILEDANKATDTYAHRNFINFLIDSIIKRFDNKMTLFVKREYDIKLNVTHKIQMPLDEQFEAEKMKIAIAAKKVSTNEVRRWLGNFDPVNDGDEDIILNTPDNTVFNVDNLPDINKKSA